MERGGWLLVILLLGACSWEPVTADRQTPMEVAANPVEKIRRGDAAAAMAERMIGTPYRWGGADVDGFDCSGLVQFAYAQAQLTVPRTTLQQRRFSRSIPREALRRGDLVFFEIEGKTNHVGLYLGDDRFVHAPSTGKRVQTASMSHAYYARRFAGAGRVPGADATAD